ncbi:tetratricopeptide repeat protein, partial [Nostoc sp. CCCryo 231-06]|nr:tetratricopeptide repeat protein [Nostoc sp. CCCryo 231-06]
NAALNINPNFFLAYIGRGVLRSDLGDKEGAIADYNAALKIGPNFWWAINNIGLIKYEQGDVKGAIKQWQEAVAINNKAAEPLLALAVTLYAKEEREQALSKAKQAFIIDKRYGDLAYLKKNLWGERLLADAKKLLASPEIQRFLAENP